IRGCINCGAIGCANIVALAHALRRVMALPEHLEKIPIAYHFRVEHDHDRLGMTGQSSACFRVGRIGCYAALIPCRSEPHTRNLPEQALDAPETAHAEIGDIQSFRKRPAQRTARYEMRRCRGNLCGSARQSILRQGQVDLLAHLVILEKQFLSPSMSY